jgi:hypothetical protein
MAGIPRRKEAVTRRGRLIAGGLGIAAAAVAGFLLYANRLELFVLPARWGRILELEERTRGRTYGDPTRRQLSAALEAFLELQGVRFPSGENGSLSVERIRTHEGDVGWLLVRTAELIRFLRLDSRGRPVGDALPAAKAFGTEPWQGHDRVHEDAYPYDIVRVNGGEACSDHSVDRRGVLQRGLVLHGLWAMYYLEGPLPIEVPVSSGVSREVRHWLLADSRPLADPEAIRKLLASPREPDRFRALYEIERLGAKGASLARSLLAHEDPDVRARAAAVLGNDPALGGELAPLLRDPSERVKRAALFALLNASDATLARSALLDLIGKGLSVLYSDQIDFDVDRLMSPEVVKAVLAWSQGEDAVPLEYLERFLTVIRQDHLRPVVPELVRHFEEVQAKAASRGEAGRPLDETLRVLVWLLARADTAECDSLLGEALSRASLQNVIDPRNILEALLERRTPLRSVDPSRVLEKLPDSLWRESLLLQVWWGVPGALERLSGRIRTAPDREWLDASTLHPLSSAQGPEDYLFGPLQLNLGGSDDLWRRHTPAALLPLLIDLAGLDPEAYLDFVAGVLRAQKPETLRSIEKDIVRLLEHEEPPSMALVGAAVKAASRVLDPWVERSLLESLESEADPELARAHRDETLLGLLRYREGQAGPGLVHAVEQVGARRDGNAEETRAERREWRTSIIAGPRWWLDTFGLTLDPKLAANILLVRWNVPGARERLLAKLREPGNDWIFDFLWEEFLPPPLVPDLKDLAARGSSEVADRIEYLLGIARRREEKAAARSP